MSATGGTGSINMAITERAHRDAVERRSSSWRERSPRQSLQRQDKRDHIKQLASQDTGLPKKENLPICAYVCVKLCLEQDTASSETGAWEEQKLFTRCLFLIFYFEPWQYIIYSEIYIVINVNTLDRQIMHVLVCVCFFYNITIRRFIWQQHKERIEGQELTVPILVECLKANRKRTRLNGGGDNLETRQDQ